MFATMPNMPPKTLARLVLLSMLFSVLAVVGVTSPAAAADKDCSDFSTQAQAQNFFNNAGPGDPHRLDADGDGVACETLPCPCSTGGGGGGGGGGGSTEPKTPKTLNWRAKVLRVIDGDTIKVKILKPRKGKKRVRMLGIDTPERGDCGYKNATKKLKKFLPRGTRVQLVSDPTQDNKDRYKRFLRYVEKNGKDANKRQIAKGMSKTYKYDGKVKRHGKYRKAMKRAKRRNKGLWKKCW